MSHPVLRELSNHRYLRERLEAEFPEAEEETLLDTLEGMTNLTDMLAEVLRSCLEDQSFSSALKARVADMQARVGRFEERARKKRELVAAAMEDAGLKKLVEPDFTVSLRPARAPLVIIDEESVPGDFWKPQPAKLDRQGLIVALGAGRDIPGALLGNPPMTLSVRTK
jgi:sulfite reductase beta subunit-like hemoprotein